MHNHELMAITNWGNNAYKKYIEPFSRVRMMNCKLYLKLTVSYEDFKQCTWA